MNLHLNELIFHLNFQVFFTSKFNLNIKKFYISNSFTHFFYLSKNTIFLIQNL